MAAKDPFESPSQDSVAPHRGDEEQERSPIRYEREPTEPIAALTALIKKVVDQAIQEKSNPEGGQKSGVQSGGS